MKGSTILKAVCIAVAGMLLMSGLASAQGGKQPAGLPWDALIELSTGSVSAGIGFSWGGGKLTQGGKEYPLKVDGLSVGSVGIQKASAVGKVYKLKKLEDINGTYTAIGAGATVIGGASGIAMQNGKGVIIDLISTTEGVHFAVGGAGVKIELKK